MSTSTGPTACSKTRRRWQVLGYGICLGLMLVAPWFLEAIAPSFKKSHWGLNAAYYNRFMARLPRSVQDELESQVTLLESLGRVAPPQLQPDSGRAAPLTHVVAINSEPDSVIRFTTDGSIPTPQSQVWHPDLLITNSILIRAKTFSRGKMASPTVTRIYTVGLDPSLPVVSLAIDPQHLNDRRVGIIANPQQRGRQWERRAFLTLLQPQQDVPIEGEVKLRVHGNFSRRAPRKRLRISPPPTAAEIVTALRSVAGQGTSAVETWVLHTASDISQIYRERLGNRLAREMGIPAPNAAPCLLFVNGEPWGVYDLMPRIDSQFFTGETTQDVTLLRGTLALPTADAGNAGEWLELYQFVEEQELLDDSAYQRVVSAIDLDSLIDFWVFMIYSADYDRPQNNMVIYRIKQHAEKWRFLAYDSDMGFNRHGAMLEHDTLAWHLRDSPRPDLKPFGSPDSPFYVRSAALFRKLMGRAEFRNQFLARFEMHLTTVFSPERRLSQFEDVLGELALSRGFELAAFPRLTPSEAESSREIEIQRIRDFLERRPDYLRQSLAEGFGQN